MPFDFSCFVEIAIISKTMVNRSGESSLTLLFSCSYGEKYLFFITKYHVNFKFFIDALYQFEEFAL